MLTLKNDDLRIKYLLFIGGIAALIAAIVFRRNLTAEYFLFKSLGLFKAGPINFPQNPVDWYMLFHKSKFYGLLFMNFFDLINFILIGIMYLGLYHIFKKYNKSLSIVASLMVFIGILIYFSTTQVFTMQDLSNQYFQSNDNSIKSTIINTGFTLLTIHNSNATYSTGLFIPYLLVTFGGLLFSILMLKSNYFRKPTAIIGIIATSIGLCLYITAPINSNLNVIPVAGSAPFLMIWYILVGIKMIKISKDKGECQKNDA